MKGRCHFLHLSLQKMTFVGSDLVINLTETGMVMLRKNGFRRFQLRLVGSLVATGLGLGLASSTLAQIIPDDSLGQESSIVTSNVDIQGIPSDRIDGGALREANLFHSFEQFNMF